MKLDNKSKMKSAIQAATAALSLPTPTPTPKPSSSSLSSPLPFMIFTNVKISDTAGLATIFARATAAPYAPAAKANMQQQQQQHRSTDFLSMLLMSALIPFQFMASVTLVTNRNAGKLASMLLPLLLPLMVLQHSRLALAGSCREAQLCCNGRDSSCVVQKAPINSIIEDLNDKPCYCDHACLKLGDCCNDFKDHCGVLDCQVSDWGQWSECNASCGAGITTRGRKVLQPAQNGGKHCPTLLQKRACQGFRCHGHRHDKKILRGKFHKDCL
uniref:SMB domain-containing protein n=1 Tax=Stomoxys calcitrans TaxID=35570 RepID=A0A1I8PIW5_STOCA